MEQNNSKIIPIHNPDEKPSVIAIFKKVCELPLLPGDGHRCRRAGGEETSPALVSCPVFGTTLLFHLPSSGSWLHPSALSSLSPSASFLPSQLRCPLSLERETNGVSVARDGVG